MTPTVEQVLDNTAQAFVDYLSSTPEVAQAGVAVSIGLCAPSENQRDLRFKASGGGTVAGLLPAALVTLEEAIAVMAEPDKGLTDIVAPMLAYVGSALESIAREHATIGGVDKTAQSMASLIQEIGLYCFNPDLLREQMNPKTKSAIILPGQE